MSTVKPKWEDFEKSVIEWSHLCVKHGVRKIAVPKIGCGRDQLDWNRVQTLLNRQFLGTGIEIAVCVIDVSIFIPRHFSFQPLVKNLFSLILRMLC